VAEYADLATQRSGLKISFIAFFSAITLLLLIFSVIVAVLFANRVLSPINKLIYATRSVTTGNYSVTIRAGKFKNELDELINTFNDMMTKLEQQKQQLIISNNQNAWRDIARKIAHEIKNPLTPIQLSAERLKSKYKDEIKTNPEVFNSCISTIIRQVTCIDNLVKEFSNFARMPTPNFEKVDITRLINDVVLLQANAHRDILFWQKYGNMSLVCAVDQNKINQVIMNILQNSVQAIREDGNGQTGDILGNISLDLYLEDNDLHVVIEDDGPGFSDVSLKKALDPYYTTRGTGTGLGLAIVHRIITDHSGSISLGRSKTLGGALVSIMIPVNNEVSEVQNVG
jgi:two-component system nitrogen regulation sensor histidine kinase NtrY